VLLFEGCLAEIAAVCTGDPLIGGPDVEHKEILAQRRDQLCPKRYAFCVAGASDSGVHKGGLMMGV